MVSRRTRNYKDRNFIASFGQFILPLAVIMAIALLYFSMKLFFLPPSSSRARSGDDSPAVSIDVTQRPADLPVTIATPPTTAPTQAQPSVTTTAPVGGTAQPIQARPIADATRPQTQAQTPQKPAVSAPAAQPSGSGQRFDVQIGAFTSRENAAQLTQKTRGQGYDVYINEGVQNGTTYFRVRVKGAAQRSASQELSAKLQAQGYPVFIVPIN